MGHVSYLNPVRCFILTLSDTRSKADDESGKAIGDLLLKAGHNVIGHEVLKDDKMLVHAAVEGLAERKDIDVLITTGGTGISQRDQTVDALDALLDIKLPGFGELFRLLSYQQVGSKAMLSRATAGTYAGMIVFLLPGSVNAVTLAMEKLIVPELKHLVSELKKL